MMRGEITFTILKLIQAAHSLTTEVADTLTYFGYQETYKRMLGLKPLLLERKPILTRQIKNLEERQRISKLLSKLKTEGLIKYKEGSKRNLTITEKGESWLKKFKDNKKEYKVSGSNELKSVWIGKTALPEDFFNDLQKRSILPHIEIFAISKTGSIKQLN